MFKQFLSQVTGLELYLIFSMMVFLLFFVLVGLRLIRADKQHISHMKNIPVNE